MAKQPTNYLFILANLTSLNVYFFSLSTKQTNKKTRLLKKNDTIANSSTDRRVLLVCLFRKNMKMRDKKEIGVVLAEVQKCFFELPR